MRHQAPGLLLPAPALPGSGSTVGGFQAPLSARRTGLPWVYRRHHTRAAGRRPDRGVAGLAGDAAQQVTSTVIFWPGPSDSRSPTPSRCAVFPSADNGHRGPAEGEVVVTAQGPPDGALSRGTGR